MAKTVTPEIEAFHTEVKSKHSCFRNCCLFLVIIFLLTVGTGIWVIARSGFGQVPFISDVVYHVPTPSALVEPKPDQVEQLSARLEAQAKDFSGGTVELTLSQEELTALIRQKVPSATVSVREGLVDYFGPIEFPQFGKQIKLYLTVSLSPEVEQGRLHLILKKLTVGQLGIPAGLLNQISKLLQKNLVDTNELIKQITIESVTVSSGEITLRGNIPPTLFSHES